MESKKLKDWLLYRILYLGGHLTARGGSELPFSVDDLREMDIGDLEQIVNDMESMLRVPPKGR